MNPDRYYEGRRVVNTATPKFVFIRQDFPSDFFVDSINKPLVIELTELLIWLPFYYHIL